MSILISREILNTIKYELNNAKDSVQIITAYCKENAFLFLNNCIKSDVSDKKLLLRFRMDDIIKGSSDFSILEKSIAAGWKTYIRFDLHAKTYIVDHKRGIITSANATNSGLNISKIGNTEMGALIDVEENDIEKINYLFRDSIYVDDKILSILKQQIDSVPKKANGQVYKWGNNITELFKPNINTLFSHEFPDSPILNKGEYISFLEVPYNKDDDIELVKEQLRWSNAYLWLINILKENDDEIFFGELSAKLHRVLVSDPAPYRKDVKILLSNFLSIIEYLQMDNIIIDIPRYSKRIRLKKS